MPPRDDVVPSSLEIRPTPNRSSAQTAQAWLKDRTLVDNAEGLWRVHDNLYDLTDFIKRHPGGAEWLEMTKGMDITEAYETHHINSVDEILNKYFVRKAKAERNVPYTFKDDGFYRTLKREIRDVLKTAPKQSTRNTAFFTDTLLVALFLFSILANLYQNYWLGLLAGSMLAMLTIAAHNYLHQKDNIRMLYFNFSLMQTREWRVSHAISHHLYTNTVHDMEVLQGEPLIQYLPKSKTWPVRFGPWFLFFIPWFLTFHYLFFRRVYNVIRGEKDSIAWYDFIPFTLPLAMYLFTGQSLLTTLFMWNFILLIGSFHFHAVGLNAAHHHPDIFHDGDTPRTKTDYDWGMFQLDAVMDRTEITGSHFLVLTNFGDHGLHHLFPTLDHGTLEFIYPTFKKVCKQFNVDLRMTTVMELVKGQFLQASREQPNTNPPNLFKKYL